MRIPTIAVIISIAVAAACENSLYAQGPSFGQRTGWRDSQVVLAGGVESTGWKTSQAEQPEPQPVQQAVGEPIPTFPISRDTSSVRTSPVKLNAPPRSALPVQQAFSKPEEKPQEPPSAIRQAASILVQPIRATMEAEPAEPDLGLPATPPNPISYQEPPSSGFLTVSDRPASSWPAREAAYQPQPSYATPANCNSPDGCDISGVDCGGVGPGSCCDSGCCSKKCPWGTHRTGLYGEFLYLRARGANVAYASEVDGPAAPPANQGIQVGRTAVVDHEYDPDFRFGFTWAWDERTSIVATYMAVDMNERDNISRTDANDIRSQVTHPLVNNAAADWLDANAESRIHFDVVDLDIRWLYRCGEDYAVNLLFGARYGRLEQNFTSNFTGNGSRNVSTDLYFEGGGLRVGLDIERHAPCYGMFLYGKSAASILFGETRGEYFQGAAFDPTEVETTWSASRTVPVLDLELGFGWHNGSGLRITTGYMVQAWLNTATTDDFIHAVHVSNFNNVGSNVSLDGLTVRAEYRW